MGSKDKGPLTVVQHLLMAHTKLTAVRAQLEQFGEAGGEDPKAMRRVELAMELIGQARHALTVGDDQRDDREITLPF